MLLNVRVPTKKTAITVVNRYMREREIPTANNRYIYPLNVHYFLSNSVSCESFYDTLPDA